MSALCTVTKHKISETKHFTQNCLKFQKSESEKSEKIHYLFADVTWFGILLSEAMIFRFFKVSKYFLGPVYVKVFLHGCWRLCECVTLQVRVGIIVS